MSTIFYRRAQNFCREKSWRKEKRKRNIFRGLCINFLPLPLAYSSSPSLGAFALILFLPLCGCGLERGNRWVGPSQHKSIQVTCKIRVDQVVLLVWMVWSDLFGYRAWFIRNSNNNAFNNLSFALSPPTITSKYIPTTTTASTTAVWWLSLHLPHSIA